MNLAAAVSTYADRLHRDLGDEHHVASPLGAWLLLALAASAERDDALVPVLGCSREDALAAARDVLGRPHAEFALAAALWHAVDGQQIEAWLHMLGPDVEVGPVPSQAAADDWAKHHTLGLIERFPLALDRRTLIVLASAVATKIDWKVPFDVASDEPAALPRSTGFAGLDLLRSPGVATVLLADTQCGRVAVHAMPSAGDHLLVVSVIADATLAAADVLAAAHPIAVALATGQRIDGRLGLFDLPLGAGHAWTISERAGFGVRDVERYDALVPAWHAESEHDLMSLPASGFVEAGEAIGALVESAGADARQTALARYTRTGFEAAAFTAIGVRASAVAHKREVRVRSALVEFTRPHAVVAVALDSPGSPWHGLPVFSAWVTRGDQPD